MVLRVNEDQGLEMVMAWSCDQGKPQTWYGSKGYSREGKSRKTQGRRGEDTRQYAEMREAYIQQNSPES